MIFNHKRKYKKVSKPCSDFRSFSKKTTLIVNKCILAPQATHALNF